MASRLTRGQVVDGRHQQPGERCGRDQAGGDRDPALARAVGERGHALAEPARPFGPLARRRPGLQPARGGDRQYRHRHDQRHRDRHRDGKREIREQLPFDVVHEDDGQEDDDRRQRRGEQCRPHTARALERSLAGCQPLLAVREDAFQHDRGGVQRHADREGDAGDRDHVERVSGDHHHEHGREHADWDRDTDQERRPELAQEQPQHADREDDPRDQVAAHEAERLVDENRRLEGLLDRETHLGERPFPQLPDLRADRAQRCQHIGPGFLLDLDRDGRVVVLHRERVAVAALDRDGRDVGETHRPPVAPVEHEVAELLRPVAAGKAQGVRAPAELREAAGHVVRAARDTGDHGDRDAEFRGAVGIEGDAQFVRRAGMDGDRADARDRLDARAHQVLDLAPVVLDRAGRAGLQLHEEPGQRFVRAAAAGAKLDARRVGVAWQRRQLVHARNHVDQRAAHVRADREFEVDERAAGVCEGLDLLQSRQAAQRLLLRLDQLGLDLGRRGGAPGREYRDDRLLDVRKELHRQPDQRDDAEHDDESDADGNPDWALQGSAREIHAAILGTAREARITPGNVPARQPPASSKHGGVRHLETREGV